MLLSLFVRLNNLLLLFSMIFQRPQLGHFGGWMRVDVVASMIIMMIELLMYIYIYIWTIRAAQQANMKD